MINLNITYEDLLREFEASYRRLMASRGKELTGYALSVGKAVLDGAWQAREDAVMGEAKLRVVSCQTGTGKSSAAAAITDALVRLDPELSVLFVVNTSEQADEVYETLKDLLPPDAAPAVWTRVHDPKASEEFIDEKLPNRKRCNGRPVSFDKSDLRNHRVAIVTNKSFGGPSRHLFLQTEEYGQRGLVFFDEQPDEMVSTFDVGLDKVTEVHEKLVAYDDRDPRVPVLLKLVRALVEASGNEPGRSHFVPAHLVSAEELDKFAYPMLQDDVRFCQGAEIGLTDWQAVAGFLHATAKGFAFRSFKGEVNQSARFVGYLPNFDPVPGSVLLDATADIDNVEPLVDFMVPMDVPNVDFRNLSITHVEPYTKTRVSTLVKQGATARAYTKWVQTVIERHCEPGEEVLAIVHKRLLDYEFLPRHLNLDERSVSFSNWGRGVGSNQWNRCTTVFLFDAFHLPKAVHVATSLGHQRKETTSGNLKDAQGKGLRGTFLTIQEGHLARWWKQLALRGCARNIDAEGRCASMKLVVTGDRTKFLKAVPLMFPGCGPVAIDTTHSDKAARLTKAKRFIRALSRLQPGEIVRASDLAASEGLDWDADRCNVQSNKEVKAVIQALGVIYHRARGQNPAYYELPEVALSA